MFSMTDVFIDDIAVAHKKEHTSVRWVFGNWSSNRSVVWRSTSRLLRVPNGFAVFSALAIFSTVAFPVLLVTKGLSKKDMIEILI